MIEQLQQKRALLFLGLEALDSDELMAACRELACLPFRKVVTLGGMPALVAAWRRAGRAVDIVSPTMPAPQVDDSRVTWLVLPGPDEPEPPWLTRLLRAWFATHAICFLGCDLEAPAFKDRYWEVPGGAGPHRPACLAVLSRSLEEGYRRSWEQKGVDILVRPPRDWVRDLLAAWNAAAQTGDDSETTGVLLAGRPYRFLDSYTEADAGQFFGRDDAIRDLGELVLAERLVLCFGPSGVGKTSLLQAGLMPRLRRQGCLPLYCCPERDPVQAVRRTALAQAGTGITDHGSLADLLSNLAEGTGRTAVVLLDQFEEVFTLLGAETLAHLFDQLAGCLRLAGAPVHVVLSLREDFLVYLHDLRAYLPGVFAHRYRLRPLSHMEAREAIEAPARLFGLHYEPALSGQLLHDLRRDDGRVQPADLQIVCDALYEDLQAADSDTFTLARYRALGGAAQLLAGYLERVVAGEANPAQVRAVLKAMVTARGTMTSLPAAEIARLAGVSETTVVQILRRLDCPHRLVRPLEQEGGTPYELIHEVLGPRVLAWIDDPAEREAKAIHDLLRAELHNWQHFGALPGPGKLQALDAQRDNPHLQLSRAEVELLVRGAVRHGVAPGYWLEQAKVTGVPAGAYLLPSLASPLVEVRCHAAELLGPKRTLKELSRMLREQDPEVRARAATMLGEMAHPRVFRLLRRACHDLDPTVRAVAWRVLETLDAKAAERLRCRDEVMPILIAGSFAYWLPLIPLLAPVSGATTPMLPTPVPGVPPWTLLGGLWFLALLVMGWLAVRLPPRLLAWPSVALAAWLLVGRWGWFKGGGVLALLWLLSGDLRRKPYLALVALLPYLPLLGVLPATSANVLWATARTLLALVSLVLLVPRWGRYGADRPAAATILSTALCGALGALLAGTDVETALLLSSVIAWGRWWARRPLVYLDSPQKLGDWYLDDWLADLGRMLWDYLDYFSLKLKPFLGGVAGALCAAVLLLATTSLPPGGVPAWDFGDALRLGVAMSLGLWWGEGSLFVALLSPVVCGVVGGFVAQGVTGAVVGSCIGLGLGIGEWLAARMEAGRGNVQSTGERDDGR